MSGRFSTLETVPTDTPACAATSLMLAGASATVPSRMWCKSAALIWNVSNGPSRSPPRAGARRRSRNCPGSTWAPFTSSAGERNALPCQLTADACGLPVVAGPAEAAALGNVLVQARALHRGPDDLAGMRALIRATQPLRRYEPGDPAPWQAAARRLTR